MSEGFLVRPHERPQGGGIRSTAALEARRFNESTGCTSLFYPPDGTHPSIRQFLSDYAEARGLQKVIEAGGMALMATPAVQDALAPAPGK